MPLQSGWKLVFEAPMERQDPSCAEQVLGQRVAVEVSGDSVHPSEVVVLGADVDCDQVDGSPLASVVQLGHVQTTLVSPHLHLPWTAA